MQGARYLIKIPKLNSIKSYPAFCSQTVSRIDFRVILRSENTLTTSIVFVVHVFNTKLNIKYLLLILVIIINV